MAANALVTTRIDPDVKEEASAVLAALGLTVSDAVRLLLTRVAQEGVLPFEPVAPTKVAMAKARAARADKTSAPRPTLDVPAAIPATTPQRYLSGMAALNLPSPEGTGDWHLIETFFKPRQKQPRLFIAGNGCPGDTNGLLGDAGIYECSALLASLNIPHADGPAFAANHTRAIADLVLVSVLEGGTPDFVQLDDWMPRDIDKVSVFELLDIAQPKLNADQQGKVLRWRTANSH